MNAVFYPDWKEKVAFSSARPYPQVLVENERLKVILAGLEPGQKIPAHPEVAAVYHFLEGSGWMTVDGERHPVQAGASMVTLDGCSRGVEAESRLVFMAVRIGGTLE